MNRRETIGGLLALGSAPLIAFAQPPGKIWRVGFLAQGSEGTGRNASMDAFREQLLIIEKSSGRKIEILYRWAEGKPERLPDLANDLVRLKVDVIVAQATAPVEAAKRATTAIPIVMTGTSDPIGAGLIASLARPGGNVTGMSLLSTEIAGKRLQLLREISPKIARVAILTSRSSNTTSILVEQTQAAARKLGIALTVHNTLDPEALAGVFAAMQKERAQGVIVQLNPFSTDHRQQIVDLAARHRLVAMFEDRRSVTSGGLISYGPNLPELFRRSALYVEKIMQGAKPADLPVEQPTKFEMVVNLKTAKALGLTVPQGLLLQADEVIR